MKQLSTLILTLLMSLNIIAESENSLVKKLKPFEIYNTCKELTSNEFKGRQSGSKGYKKAAELAAASFRKWGLTRAEGLRNYYQYLPTPYTVIRNSSMELVLPDKENKTRKQKLVFEQDYLPWFNCDSFEGEADIVFAGWGISAPELGYDDFAGVDVRGKFILCFRGSPDRKDKRFRKYSKTSEKIKRALSKGALGLIHIGRKPYASVGGKFIEKGIDITISSKTASEILKERVKDVSELKRDLTRYKAPISFNLKTRIKLAIKSKHYPNAKSPNVIAVVKGKSEECIVVGAHLDHCGTHAGVSFHGAHDNAVSSAITMAVAKAFAGTRPKKTVMFILFAGEEMGLLGSKHLVNNFPGGIERVKHMVNFELTGIGTSIRCAGGNEKSRIRKCFKDAAEKIKPVKVYFADRSRGRSDHQPFIDKGCTTVCITGTGPHLNYHGSKDTILQINPELTEKIAELTIRAVWKLAN